MRSPSIKQFKLTNDDEVICEVLEWDSEDNSAIIVRAPLVIIKGENIEKSLRFYAFRPWMGFAEDPEILHTINSSHVIGEVNPSDDLLKHYTETLKKLDVMSKLKKTDFNFDEFEDMDDYEIENYVKYKVEQDNSQVELVYDESDEHTQDNVLQFKPKDDTFH